MNLHPEPIQISHLDYTYPDSAFRLTVDSFVLRAGEITAIIGPNGSGKSTLLRLAAGVLRPHVGRIKIQGIDIATLNRRTIACILGFLPQETPFEFDHRVIHIVSMGRYAHLSLGGFLRERDLNVIERCLRHTDTLPLKDRRFSRLSGGERQRVLLASVLAQEPSILLLDEPTSALDLHHQINFFTILKRLAETGLSVAVVLHDLNYASLYCDRLVLMNQGTIVKVGTPDEVIGDEMIQQIYGGDLYFSRHPQSERPLVFPNMERNKS